MVVKNGKRTQSRSVGQGNHRNGNGGLLLINEYNSYNQYFVSCTNSKLSEGLNYNSDEYFSSVLFYLHV